MDNSRNFFDKIRGLDKPAKIRLCVMAAIIVWCLYLSIGYSYELTNVDNLGNSFLDLSEIGEVSIDGSDFTLLFKALAGTANIAILFMIVFVYVLYMGIIVVASLVPILIFRSAGLKKDCTVKSDEYYVSRTVYYVSIVISVAGGFIITEFGGILSSLLFTGAWALMMLIYIISLKYKVQVINEPEKEEGSITSLP